jgi:hypothetical protein
MGSGVNVVRREVRRAPDIVRVFTSSPSCGTIGCDDVLYVVATGPCARCLVSRVDLLAGGGGALGIEFLREAGVQREVNSSCMSEAIRRWADLRMAVAVLLSLPLSGCVRRRGACVAYYGYMGQEVFVSHARGARCVVGPVAWSRLRVGRRVNSMEMSQRG